MKILPLGSLGYVASLLAAILYHRNSYMKHSLWNVVLIALQWNLSKPNPFPTINFVRNRQVKFTKIYNHMFSLHRISVYSEFGLDRFHCIYTPCADGMLLRINEKFTIGKLESSVLSSYFVLKRPSLSINRRRTWRYESDLTVPVVLFISNSIKRKNSIRTIS
jgi:hypothetical protein